MAGLLPGEPLDANRMENFKKRLGSTQFFVMQPPAGKQGKPLDIKVTNRRPHDKPYGDTPVLDPGGISLTRMQNPDPAPLRPTQGIEVPAIPGPGTLEDSGPPPIPGPPPRVRGSRRSGRRQPVQPARRHARRSPCRAQHLRAGLAAPVPLPPGSTPPTPPIGTGEPPGTIPSVPGLNAFDVGPDRQDPFPGRAYADIVTAVEEAPTGRFMLGVGASSWQGLTGNLTIYERNFDIFNVPHSWNDLVSGNAFRARGRSSGSSSCPAP